MSRKTFEISARQSNIELLRFIAMLMIVLNHLSGHGVMHCLSETPYVIWSQGTSVNKLFSAFLRPGGEVGVAIFFIITGYFCCRKDSGRIVKVSLQTFFYGVFMAMVFLISKVAGVNYPEISMLTLAKNLIQNILNPVTGGGYWFVTVYVIVILLISLINPFLRKLSKKGFILILVFLWIFWYFLAAEWSIFYKLQKGLFFYIIGAFIQFHLQEVNNGKWKTIVLFFVFWIAGTLLHYEIAQLGSMENQTVKKVVMEEFLPLIETGIVVPICAFTLFRFFESLHFKPSKAINTIAATTFGVYLIHDSVVGRNLLWYEIFKVDTELYQSPLFPLTSVGVVVIVFMVCFVIDYLRLRIIEPKMMYKYNQLVEKTKRNCLELKNQEMK